MPPSLRATGGSVMEREEARVASPPCPAGAVEAVMLREDVVREIMARLSRGEGVKYIARELGIDRKTVKRWRARGSWRPQRRHCRRQLDGFRLFLERRGPEVGWNAAVLHRELHALGVAGGDVPRARDGRAGGAERGWAAGARVRFETAPGQQAQIDFGQLRVWIGERCTKVHLFVFTLGYSRRCIAYAYPHERLPVLLDGHERAFRHFG